MNRLIISVVLLIATTTSYANFFTNLFKPRIEEANINLQVLQLAKSAYDCAILTGIANPKTLTIIDYSLPSTEKRLWVLDLKNNRVLYNTVVAHGKGSGNPLQASYFSNMTNSHASSLGLYKTAETYKGQYGYSLRLIGLDPGYNSNALSRAVVLHGATYVNERLAKSGKLGLTWGCPAVPLRMAKSIIKTIKQGSLVFAYYPDQEWLKTSPYLNCPIHLLANNRPPVNNNV